jgi:hypothetical protein
MRAHKASSSNNGNNRRPTLLHLVCAAVLFSLLVFAIQSSFFTGFPYFSSLTTIYVYSTIPSLDILSLSLSLSCKFSEIGNVIFQVIRNQISTEKKFGFYRNFSPVFSNAWWASFPSHISL